VEQRLDSRNFESYANQFDSVSNLGGTFPRFFVLKFIDALTFATCIPATTPSTGDLKGPLVTSSFSCVAEGDKTRCKNGGGTCNIEMDGYYIVNILCIIFGVVTFYGYIKPVVMKLQLLPIKAWRLAE
jgi:PAT family acetyl-CoA transporter-like MFS transporter 1